MPWKPNWLRSNQRLDQRITIQRKGGERDAMNQPIDDWVDVFTTRAMAYPSPGFERTVNESRVASQPVTFEVRDEARTRAILPTDRVLWKEQPFNIVAPVEQPERGRNLRIITAGDR
jgi:head-tail adaptor